MGGGAVVACETLGVAYRRVEQRRAARRERAGGARPPSRSKVGPTPEGGRRQAWTRIVRSRADAVAARLSSPAAGALAAVWSGVITLLAVSAIVMLAWILGAGSGGVSSALRLAATGWLATHHLAISIEGGSLSALPLGFVALPGVVLWRAGSWATRRSGACRSQDVRSMVVVAAGVYGTFGLVVAGLSSSSAASVGPVFALIGTAFFAAIAFGGGASREAGLWPTLADRFTLQMRRQMRAAATGFMALVTGAAGVFTLSLIMHFGTATTMISALEPGLLGNVLLLLLAITHLPNAVIWSLGFVTGPGFAAGQATIVSPFGVDVGSLPAFPLLAAAPEGAAPWAPIVVIVPLVAGGVAANVVRNHRPPNLVTPAALRERSWVAGFIAVAAFVAALVGSGSLGPDRLSAVGPVPWEVAAATFVLVFAGGWLTDLGRHIRNRWRARKQTTTVDLTAPAASEAEQWIPVQLFDMEGK